MIGFFHVYVFLTGLFLMRQVLPTKIRKVQTQQSKVVGLSQDFPEANKKRHLAQFGVRCPFYLYPDVK